MVFIVAVFVRIDDQASAIVEITEASTFYHALPRFSIIYRRLSGSGRLVGRQSGIVAVIEDERIKRHCSETTAYLFKG